MPPSRASGSPPERCSALLHSICNGSIEEVLVGMVDASKIDQLRMLLDKIDRPKTGRN
jgi:hypothetical protein